MFQKVTDDKDQFVIFVMFKIQPTRYLEVMLQCGWANSLLVI